jgi:hypothetical protein
MEVPMNQIVVSSLTSGLLLVATAFNTTVLSAPASSSDLSTVKAALREFSRSFYQLGRDLMQVPHIELNDPKRFFELINERIDDQRAVISIVRAQAREDSTIAALVAVDKHLAEARKRLQGIEMKENYGEIALSAGNSISSSAPFREFFLKTLGGSKPTVGESITEGGN